MAIPKVFGTETEYGIAAVGQPDFNPVLSSSILISTYAEEDYADLLADSPALGFISKSALSAAAIRELLDGPGTGGPPRRITGPPER